jgi:hypothetical protein
VRVQIPLATPFFHLTFSQNCDSISRMPDYKEVFPYLRNVMPQPASFVDYLAGFYKSQTNTKTWGLPVQYLFSLEWLRKFQNKCVTFHFNSGEEIKSGASPLSIIYQLSPKLHAICSVAVWRSEGETESQLTTYIVYEKFDDALKFLEENLDLVIKEQKDKGIGFAANYGPVT